jgi:hypothetical protein
MGTFLENQDWCTVAAPCVFVTVPEQAGRAGCHNRRRTGRGSGASGVFEVCITVLPPTHIDSLAGRLVMQPVTRGKKSLLRDLGESAGSRC